ncbi:uncharacterized protein N7483_012442 [Penicillium malachiteum]|uniref:uncharacterized protein n=1 Tax=Penicillium malachiteum TaxID=1324776 RepID=UPI002546A8B3|nr:uncharacterized protein N7483_012442 [Penicillium malachiteum]KAJ5715261.1 hypothetical protein N7483_012442 [Penicillium malachiteum]
MLSYVALYSVQLQPSLIFPRLKPLLLEMLRDIGDDLLPKSRNMDYPGYIEAHGKSEAVAEELLRSVVPEIVKLEGQEVTMEILRNIQTQQDSDKDWTAAMGYLDFITDNRDWEWYRLYVGQCINSLRRIINGHAQQILKAEYGSLHHFMVWLGNGSQSANFIRLWMIEDEEETEKPKDAKEEEWKQMKMNILEALFCKAFSTHHGTVDPHAGTRGADNKIITPDQQISLWLEHFRPQKEHRLARITKKVLAAPRQRFRRDFQDFLQDALQDEELFEELKVTDLQHAEFLTDPSLVQMPFFGNQKAKVGFILDYAAVSPEEDTLPEIPDDDGLAVALPPSLGACNCKESNVLVWTFNFRKFVPLASQTITLTQAEERELCMKHYELINSSQARIIFLCGHRAEKTMRLRPQLAGEKSPSGHLKRFVLKLRGFPLSPINTQHLSSLRLEPTLLHTEFIILAPYSLESSFKCV